MRKILSLLIMFVLAGFLLSSCDNFILGPSLNLNYEDQDQGIIRFDSAVIGEGEVRVSWDWFDIERQLRDIDPIYDEIVIKHSTGSRPSSRLGGKSFKLKDWDPVDKPMWSTVFEDLKWDKEHYFALYAHEDGGRWMAPLYTSIHMEDSDQYSPGTLWTRDELNIPLQADTDILGTGATSALSFGITPISATLTNIFYYDLWDDEKVVSAVLHVNINSFTNPVSLEIYPMRNYWESGDARNLALYGEEFFAVDRSIKVEYPITSNGSQTIDITEVFAKAQQHRTQGLFIQTDGNGINMDYTGNYPTIDVEVVRKR